MATTAALPRHCLRPRPSQPRRAGRGLVSTPTAEAREPDQRSIVRCLTQVVPRSADCSFSFHLHRAALLGQGPRLKRGHDNMGSHGGSQVGLLRYPQGMESCTGPSLLLLFML